MRLAVAGRILLASLTLGCFMVCSASASPKAPPRFQEGNLNRPDYRIQGAPGILAATAGADTIYFGGTTWDAVSGRWEAVMDSCWTFDSGVGSSFDHGNPDVDPFKDPSLHATMEGWIGVDLTKLTENSFFRRLDSSQFPAGQRNCPLNGNFSFWAGVLQSESDLLCYADGQGYGNSWNICLEQTFAYNGTGDVTLTYLYENDTEEDFDFTYVYVDTTGNGDLVELAAYTWVLSGNALHVLQPGISLPSQAGNFTIKFCVVSDDESSDEDGLYVTDCGAFTLDDVTLTGGGLNYSSGFETGEDGWVSVRQTQGLGGDWTNIVHVNDLPPPLADCVCNLQDSVLVLEDITSFSGHNLYQNNIAASPWIDLAEAGVTGVTGIFLEADIYAYMPLLNYVYAQYFIQWAPYTCPTGEITESPWTIDGITHYYGIPTCSVAGSPFRTDFSALADLGADEFRVGIGVFNGCLFYSNCTGLTNTTPWYDNVKVGVCGTLGGGPTTPVLSVREFDLPQDSFPEDGSLSMDSPGRIDSGTVTGAPQPEAFTSLGDTLIVLGGGGGAEVHVEFSIVPGPGVDGGALSSYLGGLTFAGNKSGLDWYSARMDTAEQGGVVSPGVWMTAFHESDPAFVGSDTDIDPGDVDPLARTVRLANDIFPDDLLTPGSRLNLFYKTKFTAGAEWFTLPDTTGGNYLEMEVLPSSFDTTASFNCVLYVDHYDEGPGQGLIESSLAAVIPGGSANFENTAWDRYDVRAASSAQATFGRPGNTEYGATIAQALGYKVILWDSGSLSSANLVNQDAAVLTSWLLQADPGGNSLYLSGDGIAASITAEAATEPLALELLENVGGVQHLCDTYNQADCPVGSPQDLSACIDIDPVGGAVVSLRPQGGTPQGQGNGCPQNRSFDVLGVQPSPTYGAPIGEEEYSGAGKTAQFASVSNHHAALINYKMVVDGLAVHHRREPGVCAFNSFATASVEERLQEVLDWFGYSGAPSPCSDPGSQIGIGDDPRPGAVRTTLANFAPNPLQGSRRGEIRFTLGSEGPARVSIYDLGGRLVKTVHDGLTPAGMNSVFWDGTDGSGRPVASGVYFYSLRTRDQEFGKKMVVVR